MKIMDRIENHGVNLSGNVEVAKVGTGKVSAGVAVTVGV